MFTSQERADKILNKMRKLETEYPFCEPIQLMGIYIDNHVEDTLEREEESHEERLSATERAVDQLEMLGKFQKFIIDVIS
jgi:hypothetical protein